MKQNRHSRARVAVLACGLWLMGCGHAGSVARSPAEEHELERMFADPLRSLAAPCPKSTPRDQSPAGMQGATAPALSEEPPRVYWETAIYEVGANMPGVTPEDALGRLAADPSARLLALPQIIGTVGQKATMTLEEHALPPRASVLHELSLFAQLPEPELAVLELELVLQIPANPSTFRPGLVPPESRVPLTMAPRDRQAVALTAPIPDQPGRWLLVVARPYVIRGQADLGNIFQCKMENRAREVKRFESQQGAGWR